MRRDEFEKVYLSTMMMMIDLDILLNEMKMVMHFMMMGKWAMVI